MSQLVNMLKRAKYELVLEDSSFTMQKLSKISGIKLSVLNTIFYQGHVPTGETLLKLAKFLKINPVEILLAARKITPEMESELFAKRDMLKNLYQTTYWIDAEKFPKEINQLTDNNTNDEQMTITDREI